MRRKGTKPSTACHQEEGPPPSQDGAHSDEEMEQPAGEAESAAPAKPPGEELDNRSLEEILNSIPPPPPPAMASEAGAPRLMITHIVNQNFKSYAGEKVLGPFHKRFSCIIGPNGSGKSNVIDSMLFVFGYRAQKIRSKKLSVLIHNSDEHKDIQSCTVEVHFQKIIDKEGDDYEVLPNSNFYVSRTAYRDSTSVYHISGKKKTFKDVGNLLRSHGIDLDHNRFLILQMGQEKTSQPLELDGCGPPYQCLELILGHLQKHHLSVPEHPISHSRAFSFAVTMLTEQGSDRIFFIRVNKLPGNQP